MRLLPAIALLLACSVQCCSAFAPRVHTLRVCSTATARYGCASSSALHMSVAGVSIVPEEPPAGVLLAAKIGKWPCGDELDKRIMSLALPAVLNFAIFPLVGAADTFWVGRMSNALALAGQGAANQVFNSAFWFMSFLPSVITPLVAKAHGAGNQEAVRERVGEAFFIGTIMGIIGTLLLTLFPGQALTSVMPAGAAARTFAQPYLRIRGFTFACGLLSTVGFAAFRGTMDLATPLKITALSNIVNIVMDPLLIFTFGMGVPGAALATCMSELTAFVLYVQALVKMKVLSAETVFKVPSMQKILPLLVGGFSVLLRSMAINTALIAVTRQTQLIDSSGTAAAAHALTLQMFQLGSVASLALSVVASVIIPSLRAKAVSEGTSDLPAKQAADRLLIWGAMIGTTIGLFQYLSVPLLAVFSPLKDVQEAARIPATIGAVLQIFNCIIWTGEGIQQGNEDFLGIALSTMTGTAAMLVALRYFGNSLVGVWGSFGLLALFRLLGTLNAHFFTGPFARRNRKY
ncbi:mate-domain-containing protein [Ochromonadaceae sp. CCMP2298]|nr:mate-domain-containing protein [Ochromonadaceae sp. CCMP2298]|mmetsp:Transcript_8124/g.18545  ORF Transcript_8124/g.18545 Transcript_8124/m.18545 type:complete len:518 (-) Transcript_8124:2366-3919(-)